MRETSQVDHAGATLAAIPTPPQAFTAGTEAAAAAVTPQVSASVPIHPIPTQPDKFSLLVQLQVSHRHKFSDIQNLKAIY